MTDRTRTVAVLGWCTAGQCDDCPYTITLSDSERVVDCAHSCHIEDDTEE